MTTESDFWACRACRSINTSRASRCYKCHVPREVAGVKPTEMSVTEPAPVLGPTGTYRSSETRAVFATIAAVVFVFGTYIALWIGWQVGNLRATRQRDAADQLFESSQLLLVLPAVLGVLALVAYGLWISRAVANLPPLGAGYSRVSPTWAFFEPLIPGLNLYSLPARAGEVISKLGGSTIGLPLIAVSFFLIIGPPIAAGIFLRLTRYVTHPMREFWGTLGTTLLVSFTVQVIGVAIALYIVWHIEGMFRRRVEEGPAVAPADAAATHPAGAAAMGSQPATTATTETATASAATTATAAAAAHPAGAAADQAARHEAARGPEPAPASASRLFRRRAGRRGREDQSKQRS
jgi:hypothetical protein